ncbi:hypothetical protein JAAARDRAFT_198028 [Jaapia argillacea MUCL 33604]|uniref:Transposase family Tnp2 protein n=1 Tax=Jaapia argillacea MUCL 33604 TaxID=933084 RepID=A0A067PFQ2_9AGAM|nr:hypothetical protein JAAARDRAFT_198028 [Jaapia argillacea MUCL 33604]
MSGTGERIYYCDCPRYCKQQKVVPKATYYRHLKERDKVALPGDTEFARSESSQGVSSYVGGEKRSAGAMDDGSVDGDADVESSVVGGGSHQGKRLRHGSQGDSERDSLHEPSSGVASDGASLSSSVTRQHAATPPRAEDQNDSSSGSAGLGGGADQGSLSDRHIENEGDMDRGRADDLNEDTNRPMSPIHGTSNATSAAAAPPGVSPIPEIRIATDFINALKDATLDNGDLSPDVLDRLRNPITEPLNINNPDLLYSLELFLALNDSSEGAFDQVRNATHRRIPEVEILSLDQIKRRICEMTGVVPIVNHMCVNTCLAFTGPFAEDDSCRKCNEPRYDPLSSTKAPRREFYTMPIGPVLQAVSRTKEGATKKLYRADRTQDILGSLRALQQRKDNGEDVAVCLDTFDDFVCGSDYLAAVQDGRIKDGDSTLMISLDGAQLFRNKLSDCWIYIWVILDLAPDLRYKKKYVIPGGFIPGPNKPKNLDSFLFPGLHHVQALHNEGLPIWNALDNTIYVDDPFVLLGTADGPGLAYLNGLVGHHGGQGCRLHCPIRGRHKTGAPQYFPALLKPTNYSVVGCDHPDLDVYNLPYASRAHYLANLAILEASPNPNQYTKRRLQTGISKPSTFTRLTRTIHIPLMFTMDFMHLAGLNLPDLFIGLWCGSIDCGRSDSRATWDWFVLQGEVWKAHGKAVAAARSYWPGSFGNPPRNPAEKISSGYKAWEFLLYVYGLGPALLRSILPEKYWRHYCKLVFAIRLLHQRRITASELRHAHTLLIEFVRDFELLYYQRREDRLHFCRQSIHALTHLAPEVARLGPLIYYTQWTMERTIGNLGEEIRQPSNPFQNLSERGLRRSQLNALKALIPTLDPDVSTLPRGAQDLGEGYVLLKAMDTKARPTTESEGIALEKFMETEGDIRQWRTCPLQRWARLRLPNGQIARSLWKEGLKPLEDVRIARKVKLQFHQRIEYGEVRYYFRAKVNNGLGVFAMISLYSRPDPVILQQSYNTVWSCQDQGDAGLIVVDIKAIAAVVAMVPWQPAPGSDTCTYFVVEKPGLQVGYLSGEEEEMTEE